MAQAKPSVVFDAAYYQKHMPSQIATAQAQQLGITTDQLYQMYGAYAGNRPPPPAPGGQGAVGATGQAAGPSPFGGGGGGYGAWSTPVTNPYQTGAQSFQGSPAYNWIQGQVQTGVGQNILNPPQQQQQAAPQFQQPRLNPNPTIQLAPTAPLPVQPTVPVSTQPTIFQPAAQQVAQQGAPSNVLNPIPVPMQPIQQYQSGGLVTQSGGSNQQPPPMPYYANAYPIYATNAQGSPTGQPNYANPTDLAGLLGAAALQSPYVQNPSPSGTPSSKSGVAPVGGAMIGTSVPQVTPTWESVGQNAGFSQRDIDTFKAQGLTPADVVQKFPSAAGQLGGPWTTQPGVFAKAAVPQATAPLALNPITPASAVPYAPGQAFATPPAAPSSFPSALPPTMAQSGATTTTPPAAMLPPGFMGGAQGAGYVPQAFLQAHTSALADAGKALYAHFGGDPKTASPEDIANFHSQLTGAVGEHIAANQPAGGVKKAATGGLVPGRGNEDTVPALLTPGEYVIPKQQVAQLVARGALKLQSGGLVQDPDPDPPEVRRQALVVSQPSSSSAQTSSPQVPAGNSLTSGLAQAAHTYGNALRTPASGGGYNVPGGYIGASPGPGQSGYMYPSQAAATAAGDVGTGVGGGRGMSSGMQSALGGIGSGLTQAAQAIASSVKPWQMQSYQNPYGSGVAPPPQIQMQPERVA